MAARDPEAAIIYAACVLLALPVVIIALIRGDDIGAGTTLCILMVALGVCGLVLEWRIRSRLPRARVIQRAPKSVEATARSTDDTVLVVEDEAKIRRFLGGFLASEGLHMIAAPTLAAGFRELDTLHPTVVLLDLGLPDGDGIELLRHVRSYSQVPVVVLSARDSASDKAAAFEAGADDYLLKPFDPRELLNRIRLAQQRTKSAQNSGGALLTAGPFTVDTQTGTATLEGAALDLTVDELRLLTALVRAPGKVLTLRDLAGSADSVRTQDVRMHMSSLRKKIEADPARPRWIVTETGIGYRLVT
jgi:two-component system KDP operon response regulator KdpE